MDSPLVLIVEQLVAEPAQRFFTGTLWPCGMSVQEVGTKFDKQSRPIRDAVTQHLDAEVVCLEDKSIPTTCTVGQDLRTQPVRTVNSIAFISFLRCQLLSLELFMELITELDIG